MAAERVFLLLFLAFLSDSAGATGSYGPVDMSSLLPSAECIPSEGLEISRPGRLTLVSGNGPDSPLPAEERLNSRQILVQDRARVKLLQSMIAARHRRSQPLDSSMVSSTPVNYGIPNFNTNNYIVKVGFGTPKRDMNLVFDTGSDLTWIRCLPCASGECSRQRDPVFDPSKSSSFRDIPCPSHDCSAFKSSLHEQSTACGAPSVCDYKFDYADNSTSRGSLGSDTVSLGTPTISISLFRFGCGHDTRGNFGTTSGLLGLGPGNASFVSQTAARLGKSFSYYLPSQDNCTGSLSFSPEVTADVKFTPLLDLDRRSFYFVDLKQIKLGDGILPVSFSGAGTLMDSGTVITRLPAAAYAALRSGFRKAMANFTSVAPEDDLLDTCYDFSGYDVLVAVPKVALVFGGDVRVDVVVSGILYGTEKSRLCLAFAANAHDADYVVIGNKVQRGYEVIYDVGNKRLGFKAIDRVS
ncbi:hypothetical protein H6P81_008866 [Aristolochia fimbriata]|uniref:Peptidase A1 domain-containing protein n=1 Tax=Aristolochia fimbriata TaxID=158543 RepID=A0AAV7EM00_ARIFI|nr:hypothetical protein H6P81_008866 [Aristolochia fimbriata]